MPDNMNPETEYEAEGTQVFDPGDYYGAPPQTQAILDALVALAGLDRDYVTMIAIGPESIGIWHHSAMNELGGNEYLTRVSAQGRTVHSLGGMLRGDR